MSYRLDKIDMILLKELVKDGRVKLSDISRKTGIPRTTLAKRLEKLIEKRIIKGFKALIDPRALGYNYLAFILIKAKRGEGGIGSSQERLIRKIVNDCNKSSKLPWVEEAHIVTGTYDILLKVWAREWQDLTKLLITQMPRYKELTETYTMLVLLTPHGPQDFDIKI